MFEFTIQPPLSLYVHLPWCVRKCPYCDFNSHAARGPVPEQAYVDALLADLEQDLPGIWGRVVETVFIGGGTPSLFSATAIDRLLRGLRARLTLAPAAEITLEANPGTADHAHFRGYREAGVNRLSIGVQSFSDTLLGQIGRIHDAATAIAAVETARTAGFERINLDLMYGLPGQRPGQAGKDLQTAIELQAAHISWYELTIEPNTWFHRHPPQRPDSDQRGSMQAAGEALLTGAGYARYEVSAWARPGQQCRHNLNYWRFGDYIGIGAGAHGKITDVARQRIVRTARTRHPQRYLETAGTAACTSSRSVLSPEDAAFEYVLNALRLDAGFSRSDFTAATGLPFAAIEAPVARALADGLLATTDDRLHASRRGQRYLDTLLQYWLPGETCHAGAR